MLPPESSVTPGSSTTVSRSRMMQQELHWLDIPERVSYKLGILTHRCLLGKAPVYLSNCCIPVAQVATRRHLRSAARHQLTVPRHRLNTYGRRAFAVAGTTTFNTLPNNLRDTSVSTATFGQLLKTHLFSAYQHVYRIRGVSRNALYKSTLLTYLLTYLYRRP